MTKRQKNQYNDRMKLASSGWNLKSKSDYIGFNGGSETIQHLVCKTLAAYALRELGYRVASEVKHPQRGEIDIIGYGHRDRNIIAIEIENQKTSKVVSDKLNRYVRGTPIMECFVYDPEELPNDPGEIVECILGELSYA